MNRSAEWMSWTETLTRRFYKGSESRRTPDSPGDVEYGERSRLVAIVRWFLLAVLALYGALAGSTYLFSRYGFFISSEQIVLLITTIISVIVYNSAYHFCFASICRYHYCKHLQIILDIIAVTVLIHCSGGASSWFWPIYMIVTLEAAYLLDRQRDVWLIGAAGGLLYSALLFAEHAGIIGSVMMPFVDPALGHDLHFLFLMTVWVMITNAVTAIIANFLMAVIRRETILVRENEERLLGFIDNANDLIHCNTVDGKILYLNRAMQRAVACSQEELDNKGFNGLIVDDSRDHYNRELQKILAGSRVDAFEVTFKGREGEEICVEGNLTCTLHEGSPAILWGIWRDISEKKLSQARLYKLAHNDNLTGLPNRILFRDRFRQAMAFASRQKKTVALLFLDLDRFKVINDSLGHPVGDRLLQSVAKTLLASVREVDTVARFGGDEFTVVLGDLERASDVELVAQKILNSLHKPFKIDSHELFALGSICDFSRPFRHLFFTTIPPGPAL